MRVAVTGIGMVTPLGATRETTWQALRRGESGLRRLPADLFQGADAFAGGLPPQDSRAEGPERSIGYALRAAREAASDSGVLRHVAADRVACVIGSSKGGVGSLVAFALDPAWSPAGLFLDSLPCASAARVAEDLGLGGPRAAEAASCATGTACLSRAGAWLEAGRCDVAFAGSTDASLGPIILGAYQNLGALAGVVDPARACRPFDRRRDGFLIGEGAAVFVLEPLDRARRRGATVYGVLAAITMGSEPYHTIQPDPTGAGIRAVLRSALGQAGVPPESVGYVNAHGSATPRGDAAEAEALFGVLGRGALVSSTKGQTGHLLGASSAVETGLSLLALRDGWAPGNLNLREPDTRCRVRLVPPDGVEADLRCVAAVSAGFAGQVGVALSVCQEDAL